MFGENRGGFDFLLVFFGKIVLVFSCFLVFFCFFLGKNGVCVVFFFGVCVF